MAGDKISATVQYFHESGAGGSSADLFSQVLGSLVQAIGGGTAAGNLVKNNATAIGTQLNNTVDLFNAVQPNGTNLSGTNPQAFLTILFF